MGQVTRKQTYFNHRMFSSIKEEAVGACDFEVLLEIRTSPPSTLCCGLRVACCHLLDC